MSNLLIEDLTLNLDNITKVIISDAKNQSLEYRKRIIRKVRLKNKFYWQIESYKNNQVFHINIEYDRLLPYMEMEIINNYRQFIVYLNGYNYIYHINKRMEIKKKIVQKKDIENTSFSHNLTKHYIFQEGDSILPFVDLGIFTDNYQIVKSKYAKFKQINRFIEIIDDCFRDEKREKITILDFGCGKSYLTFLVYHYFKNIKEIDVKVIGYDIKADVVDKCNEIAKRYNYNQIDFIVSDITNNQIYDKDIDMIITLHACDTATDYALYNAIIHDVKYLFSVPCCQHEINKTIKTVDSEQILLEHGLIKERFSALLTDSIRAELLKQSGYQVDILEFVDWEDSPKNLMIRARKSSKPAKVDFNKIEKMAAKYHFNQTLLQLLKKHQVDC